MHGLNRTGTPGKRNCTANATRTTCAPRRGGSSRPQSAGCAWSTGHLRHDRVAQYPCDIGADCRAKPAAGTHRRRPAAADGRRWCGYWRPRRPRARCHGWVWRTHRDTRPVVQNRDVSNILDLCHSLSECMARRRRPRASGSAALTSVLDASVVTKIQRRISTGRHRFSLSRIETVTSAQPEYRDRTVIASAITVPGPQ